MNKTAPTGQDAASYLDSVAPAHRRADALALDALFRRVTGFQPRMWGASIIGYGRYHYRYDSGREGDFLATGFAPRKANLVVYILPGYTDFSDILGRLGPHRRGKSCLYLTRLAPIDMDVLAELIRAGLDDLGQRWTVLAR
ncbi:DUF1801 domain-containing protein [Actibacterium ureilyticum]|uniref:DUF1801 domain-containing protein n=1 Tax=Actibacterium ureilyticum TaxID=1590614 RepID=UPI000BAAB68D|nr:DUF1801 domain-containing protein [Actibacterium ureilyticum]